MTTLVSQPIGEIDTAVTFGDFYIPLSGYWLNPNSTAYTIDEANAVMSKDFVLGESATVLNVSEFSASVNAELSLYIDGASVYNIEISAAGIVKISADIMLPSGGFICYKLSIPSGFGTFNAGCITTTLTPTK